MLIKNTTPELPTEGVHWATLVDIVDDGMQETRYGPKEMINLIFKIDDQFDPEGNALLINQKYSKLVTPESNFGKLLKQCDITVPNGRDFETNDLIGVRFEVIVYHRVDGRTGRTYANISRVKPKRRGQHGHEIN